MNTRKVVSIFLVVGFALSLFELIIGISPRDKQLFEAEGSSSSIKNCKLDPASLYYKRINGITIVNKDTKRREIKIRGKSWDVAAGGQVRIKSDFRHGDFVISCDNKDAGYLIVP